MSKSSAPLIIVGMACCLLSVSAGVGGYLVYDHQQQCANMYANNYTSDATSNVGCTFNPSDSSSNTSTSNTSTSNTSTSNTATVVVPADPDTFRPSTYSSEGGKCINTACRVTTGACPTGFRGIGCSNPVPEACSQAGRHAGCVPFTGKYHTGGEADTFRPSTYSSERWINVKILRAV